MNGAVHATVVSGVQRIFNCGHIYKIILLQIK